ncbi:MAG: T9SS type A sorting domain-containing protein [candidate division WOR-3 bacterium]|nr:T9SS type A sorting domain-containing protein [candidate division WOR-3 bacterium]
MFFSFLGILEAQLWSGLRSYGGANQDYLEKVDFNAPDDRIVFTFLLSNSYKIDNTSGSDFVMIMVNPYGSSVWERVIGSSRLNEWVYEIDYDQNNDILVGGISCTPDGGSISFCSRLPSDTNEGFVIRLNRNNGSFINAIRIRDLFGQPDIGNYLRVLGLKSTNDGGFVIGGEIAHERQQNNAWVSTTQGFIAKFNNSMNLQWIRVVGDTTTNILDYRGITSVLQANDNNIIAVSTSRNGIWVGKFNVINGNLIWQRFYNRTRNSQVTKLSWAKLASDGSIIIADHINNNNHSDVLFVKLNSDGNFVCARQFGTVMNDAGIDITEGQNYYYITGFWYNANPNGYMFYAKINKTDCSLVSVRYLLGMDGEGRGIVVRGGIPYIVGWSNYSQWSNGNYDGILAADSGIQDTCYWRTWIPEVNQSISLVSGSNWNIYNATVNIRSHNYTSVSINVSKKAMCGYLTPVNKPEYYEDCFVSISKKDGFLYISSNSENINSIKIYNVNGKVIYEGSFNSKMVKIPISVRTSIYVIDVNFQKYKLRRKVFIGG